MKNILAIDDSEDNLNSFELLITSNIKNTQVLKAHSGKEGLLLLETNDIDLVLLDLNLPDLDGFEVCSIIKSNPTFLYLPIIMITAQNIPAKARVKGMEIGADAFVSKPYEGIELLAMIKVILRMKNAEGKLRAQNLILEKEVERKSKIAAQNENKYLFLFQSLGNPVVVLDKNYNILELNNAFVNTFNIEREKAEFRNFLSLIKFVDNKALKEVFETVINKGEPNIAVSVIEGNNDEKLLFHWYLTPSFRNLDGEIQFVIASGFDITRKQAMELKLWESESKFRSFFEQSSDGVVITDDKGIVFEWNKATEEITGIAKTDVVFKNIGDIKINLYFLKDEFSDIQYNDKKNSYRSILRKWIENKETFLNQLFHFCLEDNFTQKFISVVVFPIELQHTTLYGMFVRDITVEHIAKQELARSKQELSNNFSFLSTLIDTIPYPVFHKDLSGIYKGCNNAFAEFFGKEKNEILGKTIFEITTESVANAIVQRDNLLLTDKKLQVYEIELQVNDDVRNILINKALYKSSTDETSGIVGILIDVSDRKHTEQKLREARDKAEQADKLKSSFLANMSHEIRTPLNAISGFAGLLEAQDLSTNRKKSYISHINQGVNALINLIDNIIEVATIDSGQVVITNHTFTLDKFIADIQNFMYERDSTLFENEIIFEINNQLNNDFVLTTDFIRLKIIIFHLLDNAIKFTRKGTILLTINKFENSVVFAVQDSGIGIDAAKFDYIFERFTKIEEYNKQLYSGTGLGLYIAKKLSHLLNGKIEINSTIGKGSVFSFHLPIFKDNNLQNIHLINKDMYNWSDKTILIAEDEEINYIFLEEALLDTGVKVLLARNGVEAVDIFLANQKIDLVLLDIKMPELNGYEVNMIMKKNRPHIPVIAQTAYALSGEKEKIIESGFDDYIAKPIRQAKLLAIISKYFGA